MAIKAAHQLYIAVYIRMAPQNSAPHCLPFSENYSNLVCKYLVGPLVPEIGQWKCLNLNRTIKT